MILNHSKTIKSVIFLLCSRYMYHNENARDIILLIAPACFSTFYRCAMVPTLVENSKFFCVLVFITVTYLIFENHLLLLLISNTSLQVHECTKRKNVVLM